MNESTDQTVFYTDLADWWPLISPVEEYAEEAALFAELLRGALPWGGDVLELGSGGGSNAAYLKAHFRMTLTDVSEAMLSVSRRLNPECEHVRADMRSVRLGRTFDAVFMHDAVGYMTDEADLRLALLGAAAHCRPGGAVVIAPDDLRETFTPDSSVGGTDAPDGRGVRFLEWSWDPDPHDTRIRTEYAFVLRERDGTVRSVHETHHLGLFGRATWLALLDEAGFDARIVTEVTSEDRTPRDLFVGRRR
jgi:SAM-dependent methyltransferase